MGWRFNVKAYTLSLTNSICIFAEQSETSTFVIPNHSKKTRNDGVGVYGNEEVPGLHMWCARGGKRSSRIRKAGGCKNIEGAANMALAFTCTTSETVRVSDASATKKGETNLSLGAVMPGLA